ncbi:MAG: hypothetical protein ACK40A_13605, partial [Pannonibacter indicus]
TCRAARRRILVLESHGGARPEQGQASNRKSSAGYIMPLQTLRKSLAVMEDLQAKHGCNCS